MNGTLRGLVKPILNCGVSFTILTLLLVSVATGQSSGPAPKGRDEKDRGKGKQLYRKVGCSNCHNLEGQGSALTGPKLAGISIPLTEFITYARQPAKQMPPYSLRVLSDQQLSEIYEYLHSFPDSPDVKTIPLLRD
jgi:mono/diheme cytochrome c family protein